MKLLVFYFISLDGTTCVRHLLHVSYRDHSAQYLTELGHAITQNIAGLSHHLYLFVVNPLVSSIWSFVSHLSSIFTATVGSYCFFNAASGTSFPGPGLQKWWRAIHNLYRRVSAETHVKSFTYILMKRILQLHEWWNTVYEPYCVDLTLHWTCCNADIFICLAFNVTSTQNRSFCDLLPVGKTGSG